MRIFKYACDTNNPGKPYEFLIPAQHRVLHFDMQNGILHLWAEVDPLSPQETHTLVVLGTGFSAPPMNSGLRHLHTWFDRPYVWHLYGNLIVK